MRQALVIFGSTGNLTYKKLLPAVNRLVTDGHISTKDHVYMIGRRDWTTDTYLTQAKQSVKPSLDWDTLGVMIDYIRLDVHTTEDYRSLADRIKHDGYEDVSVYLALPPKLFPTIASGISESGFITKGEAHKRIVFEKPFGEDLASARKINQSLWSCFTEDQMFRIDHYLGKEMIQNIFTVRFANRLFEQSWDHEGIESVTILAKEDEGVMTRGGYYDKIGAIKDMLQSHLLQMASLVAMHRPASASSKDIRREKVRMLKALSFDRDHLVRGQYEGYRSADKVADDSNTETFVYARAAIDTPEWEGVPFHFLTGKNLGEKRSEIVIRFKNDAGLHALYPETQPARNRLVIKVAPEEGVELKINVKEPGLKANIRPASLDYCHACKTTGNTPEAYEKLLLDLFEDNHTLFTGWDEIEMTWTLVESLRQNSNEPFRYASYDDVLNHLKDKGVDIDDL